MVPEKIVDKVIEYVDNSIGQMLAAVEAEDYEIASIIRDDLNRKLEQVKVKLLRGNFTKLTEDEIDLVFQTLKKRFIINWSEYFRIDPNKHIEEE
jgi:hypothetical protein